jgi:hypothetical protein
MACGWLVDSLCASHIVNFDAVDIPNLVYQQPRF